MGYTVQNSIWDKLAERLGRQPTNEEARAEVERILDDAHRQLAEQGKLSRQRR